MYRERPAQEQKVCQKGVSFACALAAQRSFSMAERENRSAHSFGIEYLNKMSGERIIQTAEKQKFWKGVRRFAAFSEGMVIKAYRFRRRNIYRSSLN